jgi:hypothetical protein
VAPAELVGHANDPSKDSPEGDTRNDAVYALMQEWGRLLLKARRACLMKWGAAVERGDVSDLPPSAVIAFHLVGWLGDYLSRGAIFDAPAVATLERVVTVFKAKKPGDRTTRAAAIIEEEAAVFRAGSHPPEAFASHLVTQLNVHTGGDGICMGSSIRLLLCLGVGSGRLGFHLAQPTQTSSPKFTPGSGTTASTTTSTTGGER